MKRLIAAKFNCLFFLFILCCFNSYAQDYVTIRGVVRDKTRQEILPGAEVTLTGPSIYRVVTDANGQFLFVNIPKANYKLKVNYIGYELYATDLSVSEKMEFRKNIELTSINKELREVVVRGNRFGQAKALNAQKEAVNIKNVVSEEQIERFPDMNTAEVLQRVPGVTIQRSAGEGRFAGLRGTNPAMTNITVNGGMLATSNGTDRVVELDVINAGQLGGLEVSKVITPDMDANAIGGTINLKTRSAFEYNTRVLDALVGLGKNSLSSNNGFRGAFNYLDRLGKKKNFGVSFNASFTRTSRESTSNEQTWGDRTSTSGKALPLALRRIILRQSINQRDRLGLSGQLEYKFNDKNRIFLSSMFNKRWDDQVRNDLTARIDQGKYLDYTQVTGARFVKGIQDRVERQQANSYEFGGINQVGKLKIDYRLTYSNAYTKKSDGQLAPEFLFNGVNLTLSELESRFPLFAVTNEKDVYGGGNYNFDVTDLRFENTNNSIYGGALNFTLPLQLTKKSTGALQFGGKFRSTDKDRQDVREQWKWKGVTPLQVAQFEDAKTVDGFQDGHYTMGHAINGSRFREFFLANQTPTGFTKTDRPDVNFGEPYNADEDVTGVYLMGTQSFNKLLVLAGVRAEFTQTAYTGNTLVVNNNTYVSAAPNTVKRSYNNFFPNLQFRYRLTQNSNLRLAYSQGLAYPNFFDQVPYSIINVDPSTKSILRGNGYLDPTTSKNYDLLAEHFFKGIGILSGGVFYKDLDRFNFRSIGVVSGGTYDGYRYDEPVNGKGAKLYGAEVSWQQQFTFLPGFLSGFGIFGNYTYTQSKDIELGTINRTDIDLLPQQLKHVGNLALSYEKYGLTARIAANMSGKYIDKVGADSNNDEWVKGFTQWDFSASQRFLKSFDLFFEWNNIFNEGLYTYTGQETRSRKYEINGTTVNLGLKWSLK
jgi:TonB-dependent receptor